MSRKLPNRLGQQATRGVLTGDITRRVDFALFMVEALVDDELIRVAPAIVGRPRHARTSGGRDPGGAAERRCPALLSFLRAVRCR
ncbi:hypothetical protein [Streptosporangium sp. NPDC002607]